MNIQSIGWEMALPIRHAVLWPDKPLSFCKVEDDETAKHYGAYINNQLVCVASIYIDEQTARLRKFATLADFQGRGIGSQMLAYIIDELKKLEINLFWCDARQSAQSFYQRFGLKKQGAIFEKSGIPYYKMAIKLL